MHEVVIERKAERDIKALPPENFHRIIPQLKSLAVNPTPPGCRKITGSKNDWRIRLAHIAFFMKLIQKQRPLELCAYGTAVKHTGSFFT